ncbi:two-component sensor histidine kinase [Neptunitalea chrysea]|uniref:histidine kinase n=1 Tax=Neptunitalea chrysea TaxID=1647581 RepID=A0A9W6EVW0_9FLAO|nr:ATP-binding protein [Neptunitalea chrysea]GLB53436.1 two-component sensor histidine kinase [Neptunitalea chrysea]
MNSLLKRQIRKFLSTELAENPELEAFFKAISLSYDNFDEQSVMIQRAMQLSSEELFSVNAKLRKESTEQKKVIKKLNKVIDTLKISDLTKDSNDESIELQGGSKLVDLINNQAQEVLAVNKQRAKLLKNLELQNEELSNYAHMVSHDLKSPLRSIDALTMWLKEDYEGVLDEAGVESLVMIRNNVEKMETLINGILEYSTIDKTDIKLIDVDINFLVPDMLKSMYVPNHIKVIIKNRLPVVKGHAVRLRQVFQNLIGNAIRYNDKEEGIITIGCANKGSHWEFHVKDNGIGIEKQYYDKIFKTFEKLGNNPEATGIGLSIVKKIIEFYNGKVWLTSTPGEGTTFYFTLKNRYGNT